VEDVAVGYHAQVVIGTDRFDDDLAVLTEQLGFRIDVIFPADQPAVAVVSGHGLRLRLQATSDPAPVTVRLVTDDPGGSLTLPGGTRVEYTPATTTVRVPDNRPSVTIARSTDGSGVGRAGMRYRDLIPDRWGGRFIASHITITDGGPVPDYVHFHKIRFQMIFVKSGWVTLVYEDQGAPFTMQAGDCVLQPPEIRHRVLESSAGLEVVEVGCPAEHETIADWSTTLPTRAVSADRDFGGQRFVRHVAAGAAYAPWRIAGWEFRDTGIASATRGLAGVRVARPTARTASRWIVHDTEFSHLVVLAGAVTIEIEGGPIERLGDADSIAIPGGTRYRLVEPTADCELLDVTLPAEFDVVST
jgi:mannose-6-phosphate isomerase-like protein (cupin superfamily)